MVGRSISNPLLSIRPFATPWRWKNRSSKKDNVGEQRERMTSIDETIFLGDESQLIASQDFSPSCDAGSGCVEGPLSNSANGLVCEECFNEPALSMKPSLSEPSFSSYHPDAAVYFFLPMPFCDMAPDGLRRYSTGSYPLASTPITQHVNPRRSASTNSNDPSLQARIEAVRIQQQFLGENHPDVIFALSNLARLHQRLGNHDEAASILRESQMRSSVANFTPHHSPSSRQKLQEEATVPTEISF